MTRRRGVVACVSATGLVAASLGGVAASAPARTPAATVPPAASATPAAPSVRTVERAPVRTLQGHPAVWNPSQVAVLPDGALVVANEGDYQDQVGGGGGSITVHAAGARGATAPRRIITGERTGLDQPSGVDVDDAGRIYVADVATDTISVFAPGDNGDEAPAQQFRARELDGPTGIDVVGNRLAVANQRGNSVAVFAVDTTTGRIDARPERLLSGGSTRLVDPFRVVLHDGELTVGTQDGRVLTYGYGAHGDAEPEVARTIGARVTGLARGPEGHVYVASQKEEDDSHPPVQVFAPGSLSPVVQLTGVEHDLELPRGLALLSHRQVVVTDEADDAVHTYDDLLSATTPAPIVRTPTKVRALKVRGGPRKARRAVVWRAPKTNGGAPITRHRVVVKKGRRTVLRRVVTKRRTVLRRGQLPQGRLVVRVAARNSEGFGPARQKRFRVRR